MKSCIFIFCLESCSSSALLHLRQLTRQGKTATEKVNCFSTHPFILPLKKKKVHCIDACLKFIALMQVVLAVTTIMIKFLALKILQENTARRKLL